MKVYLINPDYMVYPDPPLALCYLASYARKYNPHITIQILDQLPEDKILEKIKKDNPDIIGLSSASQNYYKVKKIAEQIKSISNSILIIGGIHVTNLPNSFDNSPFDLGIIGEGEKTFSLFLRDFDEHKKINIKSLKKIKGLLLRDNNKVINTGFPDLIENLDDIPIPARDLLKMEYYTLPSLSGNPEHIGIMLTSRGCPYNCKFCSSTTFWKRKIRFFSAQRVADEIEILHKKYGYNWIEIYDDLFTSNKQRLKEIIQFLREKKILGKVNFTVMGRANCFDEELAVLLKELNVKNIYFGIESGSPRIVEYLKDKITLDDDIRAIEISRKYGLNPGGLFMIGVPGEKEEDMEATYQFILKYLPDNYSLGQMSAFPNTPIWDCTVKKNLIKKDMYENKTRGFLEFDENFSLNTDVSKEKLREYWIKIKSISPKKRFKITRLADLRPRHIRKMITPIFFKKVYYLGIKKIKQD